jgi:hypothetical protein
MPLHGEAMNIMKEKGLSLGNNQVNMNSKEKLPVAIKNHTM